MFEESFAEVLDGGGAEGAGQGKGDQEGDHCGLAPGRWGEQRLHPGGHVGGEDTEGAFRGTALAVGA